MEWILAQLTIPARTVETALWALGGYIAAAIGWGFRVELKLAKLDRDQQVANQVADSLKGSVERLVKFEGDARVHMARVDERLDQIVELVKHK